MTNKNKILSTNLNNDQRKQLLPLISNQENENNTMNSINKTDFIHEKSHCETEYDEKSTKTMSSNVPGTPAAQATNYLDTNTVLI